MSELCRIILQVNRQGLTDVHGPLEDKGLCREILREAEKVIKAAPDYGFQPKVSGPGAHIIVTYDESGRVDVGAPLPNREFCARMIEAARAVIDRYGEASEAQQFGGTLVS